MHKNNPIQVLIDGVPDGIVHLPDDVLVLSYKESKPVSNKEHYNLPSKAQPRKKPKVTLTEDAFCRNLVNFLLNVEGLVLPSQRATLYEFGFFVREKKLINANREKEDEVSDLFCIISYVRKLRKLEVLLENARVLLLHEGDKQELEKMIAEYKVIKKIEASKEKNKSGYLSLYTSEPSA
jgi:hypothetical protein